MFCRQYDQGHAAYIGFQRGLSYFGGVNTCQEIAFETLNTEFDQWKKKTVPDLYWMMLSRVYLLLLYYYYIYT